MCVCVFIVVVFFFMGGGGGRGEWLLPKFNPIAKPPYNLASLSAIGATILFLHHSLTSL